jgi:hypothetical protein
LFLPQGKTLAYSLLLGEQLNVAILHSFAVTGPGSAAGGAAA